MSRLAKKRQLDFQVIAQWVGEGERVLDLGCGRGVLLEYLKRKKNIYGVGVDIEFDRIVSCVKRGIPAYQGDIRSFLKIFPDKAFDRVIFSRTVEQLDLPDPILAEGLRVGRQVTVGFVNHGFWLNRVNYFFRGERTINEVYPNRWYEAIPSNAFSVKEFEAYCASRHIRIDHRVLLSGNWLREQRFLPNLMAGYAIYDLSVR